MRVEPGSPAAAAGIQPGDALEKVAELPLRTSIDLERALFDRPAKGVPVHIRRHGEALDVTLVLQPATRVASAEDVIWRRFGVKLRPIGAEAVTRVDRQLRGGLVVQELSAGSSAARAGLQKGDILIGLHQWESVNLDNVLFVLNHKDLASFNPVKAYFLRDGRVRETVLQAAE
jgi:serine protease Do